MSRRPLRWLSCCAFLPLAAGKALRVLRNGAPVDEEPFSLEVKNWQGLRDSLEEHFGTVLKHDPATDWWLATYHGAPVADWDDLEALPADPLLYVVPSGKLFQWGPQKIGERFAVNVSDRRGVEMETVATSPRLFLIHNFLDQEEATGLIDRALERTGDNALQKSGVGFSTTGKRSTESSRTSASAFDRESEVAQRVLKRSFDLLRVPFMDSMADGLQILRYQEGQAYTPHKDWFPANTGGDKQNFNPAIPGGSNRYATLFLYLWSPPSGGYTVFPRATVLPELQQTPLVSIGADNEARERAMRHAHAFYNDSSRWELGLTEQCYTKLAVRPVQLGAALFYHQDPMTGKLIDEAEHGACPSMTGTKWGANLWLWNTHRHLSQSKSSEPVAGEFFNDGQVDMDLAWSTDDGAKWVHFATAVPGSSFTANTFEGHWWRFTERGTDKEVRRFVVPGPPSARFYAVAPEPIKTPTPAPAAHKEL